MYKFGEEISYSWRRIKIEDKKELSEFRCENKNLDKLINKDIVDNTMSLANDASYYIFKNNDNGQIIAIVGLTMSGILHEQQRYRNLLPAIKIDILAVDHKYQKLHYDVESLEANDHYYLSDDILGQIIKYCREISEKYILAEYILLYADKNAIRYYERNGFSTFEEFMSEEYNMYINENVPMYMDIRW